METAVLLRQLDARLEHRLGHGARAAEEYAALPLAHRTRLGLHAVKLLSPVRPAHLDHVVDLLSQEEIDVRTVVVRPDGVVQQHRA